MCIHFFGTPCTNAEKNFNAQDFLCIFSEVNFTNNAKGVEMLLHLHTSGMNKMRKCFKQVFKAVRCFKTALQNLLYMYRILYNTQNQRGNEKFICEEIYFVTHGAIIFP